MRTVTFSNEKVAKQVNESFVSTWYNRNSRFHNCDFSTERRIVTNSYECFATQNICTFFVTPKREVLHYFSGYLSPEFFQDEVRFVLKLAEATLDEDGNLKRGWARPFRKLHKERSDQRKKDASRVAKMRVSFDRNSRSNKSRNQERPVGRSAAESKPCTPGIGVNSKSKPGSLAARKGSLVEGLQYLRQVHRFFVMTSSNSRKIYLNKVLRQYRGGNSFTEE